MDYQNEAPAPSRFQQIPVNGGTLAQPQQRSPITIQIDQGAKLRAVLASNIDALNSRLASILAPEPPPQPASVEGKRDLSPMLADQLSSGNAELDHAIGRLRSIIERLHL